ncbi:acyl carrier protein [Bacteroides thetaiotaomicron]|jgi:putative acyl carrier protein|uniref:acyl carrier protein n=1 Tax=Bacteroides thetaiotaomicron TaxID=818 RepID=UPI002AB0083C|nr:acyl carrier protein [Bacteroides thetaiotaomicron]
MEKLLEILKDIRPDVDFENEDALIDDGVLDSFDVVSIISEIDDEFGVQVKINELNPENFNSVESIWDMIQKLQNK